MTTQQEATGATKATYMTRLLFNIEAESPQEAVAVFIEQLTQHGFREWVYRVENLTTGQMIHLDGHGVLQDLTAPASSDDDDDDDDDDDEDEDDEDEGND